jgi:hypothetical protein
VRIRGIQEKGSCHSLIILGLLPSANERRAQGRGGGGGKGRGVEGYRGSYVHGLDAGSSDREEIGEGVWAAGTWERRRGIRVYDG